MSSIKILSDQSKKKKKVTNIFLTGRVSATMVIPIETARKYGLVEGSHVTVEETPVGILIRRLDI
jgi:hypothetical protein